MATTNKFFSQRQFPLLGYIILGKNTLDKQKLCNRFGTFLYGCNQTKDFRHSKAGEKKLHLSSILSDKMSLD